MTVSSMAADAPAPCLVNGVPTSQVSVFDRGLAYGDGLFETMRVVSGRIPLAEYHFARLAAGIKRLRMPGEADRLRAEAELVAASMVGGTLKLILTRGEGQRGYAMPVSPSPTRILIAGAAPQYPVERARDGITLFPCETRLGLQPLLAGIKHLNRLEQVLARSEWQDPQFAEGLVCDWQSRPVECTMSNIFLRLGPRWVTPSLDDCGVRGVMRDYLIDHLRDSGNPVEERAIEFDELLASSELFCCNSQYGVWPIVALGDRRWEVGSHTRTAQAIAAQVFK